MCKVTITQVSKLKVGIRKTYVEAEVLVKDRVASLLLLLGLQVSSLVWQHRQPAARKHTVHQG